MLHIHDVIIIGGGPAGLAAGVVLKSTKKDYLILEKGKNLINRDPNSPFDISSGIGGCGLFSDGKLSFPPSASYLWTHFNGKKLKIAYQYLSLILDELGQKLENWNDKWCEMTNDNNIKKSYNSIMLNNFMRTRILNYFYDTNINNIKVNFCVDNIVKIKTYYEISGKNSEKYYTKNIIVATGKFGNKILDCKDIIKKKNIISKIELGIRIETSSKLFKPYTSPAHDFKIIETITNGVEFRTFCCCKDGIVLKSEFDDFVSYNGSRTQLKTQKSNIGLLVRSLSDQNSYYKEMKNKINSKINYFEVSLNEFINGGKIYIGETCDKLLKEKMEIIIDTTKECLMDSRVYGPEIEYVGKYLDTNENLNVQSNIWMAGDVTGRFRGLTAALVSGMYCANEIENNHRQQIQKGINQLGIKVSNSKNMDLIFTAQSKKYFYCKDVICEFVLKQEKLPINPFMVFGYFLNDRVNRDLVRQGNNQLIQSCKELWVFGPIADGVLFEIALAKSNGKPIRFFELGTRIDEIKEMDVENITFEPEVHSRQIKKNDLIDFIKDMNIDDGQLTMFDDLIGDGENGF
jgi:uncharacterized FAD-dependent dehydrogenase